MTNPNDYVLNLKYQPGTKAVVTDGGMTKREFMAAMMLEGLLSDANNIKGTTYDSMATQALAYTDALLKALGGAQS